MTQNFLHNRGILSGGTLLWNSRIGNKSNVINYVTYCWAILRYTSPNENFEYSYPLILRSFSYMYIFNASLWWIFRILQPFIALLTTRNLIGSCQAHLPLQFASNINYSPDVSLVLWLTASHTWVARAKQAPCLLHWLSVFTLAVLLFCFALQQNH